MRWPRRVAALPIHFYRRFLSPLKPPTCRFHPTCSEYGLDALRVHGVAKGTLLTCWRILRCQPFSKGGLDPVPPPGRWKPDDPPAPAPGPEPGGRNKKADEPP